MGDDDVTVQLTTPISGYMECVPSASMSGEWVNTRDSHDLNGMVVRDYIRNSDGLPKF